MYQPIPEHLKKQKGRPKGKTKSGLSLDKRLKILSKIATDDKQKATDIIAACKEITALLNDKIKETESGIPVTTLSFMDKIETKPLKIENKEENLVKNIEKKEEIIPDKIVEVKEITNNGSISMTFKIE